MPLSSAVRPLKRAAPGLANRAFSPPGKPQTSLSVLPSLPPSARAPRAHSTAPREPPRAGPGWGRAAPAGHVRAPAPALPRAPRGRGGPAAGLSPRVGPGRAAQRDRRDTGSRSAPTAAAVAKCFDVREAAARPPPAHCACAGPPSTGPAAGRAERSGRTGTGFACGGPVGNEACGIGWAANQPLKNAGACGFWGTEMCS